MAYEPKDGDFVLYVNDRKVKDTHPDYSGNIIKNGKKHFLNAWIKPSKNGGDDFISGTIGEEMKPKGSDAAPPLSRGGGFPGVRTINAQAMSAASAPAVHTQPALDDEIPF
jgi:hypothetical protein